VEALWAFRVSDGLQFMHDLLLTWIQKLFNVLCVISNFLFFISTTVFTAILPLFVRLFDITVMQKVMGRCLNWNLENTHTMDQRRIDHIFTARLYASAVYAVVMCPSVPGTLVLWRQRSWEILTGSPPTAVPNRGGIGSYLRFSTNVYILKTVQDRDIVTMERW